MNRNMTEQEFNAWRQEWLREKGCPFFTCSQVLNRKTCGNTLLCGCLFNYEMYKTKKWIKVCDIKLTEDEKKEFPTKMCPSCTSSMCLKMNHQTGEAWAQSPCKLMNDFFERKGMKVLRRLEQYILTWGVYLLPIIGEEGFLKLRNNPEVLKKAIQNIQGPQR